MLSNSIVSIDFSTEILKFGWIERKLYRAALQQKPRASGCGWVNYYFWSNQPMGNTVLVTWHIHKPIKSICCLAVLAYNILVCIYLWSCQPMEDPKFDQVINPMTENLYLIEQGHLHINWQCWQIFQIYFCHYRICFVKYG